MSTDRHSLTELDAKDAKILFALAALFVLSRLFWLDENVMSAHYWEEAYRWIAAHEILAEPLQPLLEYQADHYQGGSLVMILLTMGSFLLFGESLFTLKLAALLVSTGTLIMLYIVGAKAFSRTTALVAALAYLAGPPLVAFWGVNVMGSHSESILISLVTILLFYEIRAGRLRTAMGWSLFGFVAGFGAWFCPTAGLPLIACAIAWLMLERIPRLREILSVLLGAMLGLVPWVAYNVRHDFVGMARVLELFGMGDPVDPWVAQGLVEKLVALITRDFPVGLVVPVPGVLPELLGPVLIAAGTVPYALGLLWTGWHVAALARAETGEREERSRELLFMVYGLVFLAVFLASRFTVFPPDGIVVYRLFVPPAVLLLLPAANAAGRAIVRGGFARRAALAGCALCILSFATATVLLASDAMPRDRRADLVLRGYVVRGLLLHRKYEGEIERAVEASRVVRGELNRAKVLSGIGWGLEYRFEQDGSLAPIERTLALLGEEERDPVLAGMLWFLRTRNNQLSQRVGTEREGPRDREVRDRLARLDVFTTERRAEARPD